MRRAARIASEVGDAIVVTTRAFADAVRDVCVVINVVINDEADEGMASSIRAGVAACDGDVLLMLCDQPHVTADHLRALRDAPIVATGYAETIGVPADFARQFLDELLALRGDVGAKKVIEAHRDVVKVVRFEGAAFDVDID